MPLELPKLDDRQFEDILAEARLRIQRYCPEWTDYNDSDPGMAIVQLFAWLTELMIYKLNQVPHRNYLAFLKMLNLELTPAVPARTQVVFSISSNEKKKFIPPRAQFLVSSESGDSLVFETSRGIDLVPYPLNAVASFDGIQFVDHSSLNEEGKKTFFPFGPTPQVDNALYLGFEPVQDAPQKFIEGTFPEKIVLYFFAPSTGRSGVVVPSPSQSGQDLPRLIWEYQSRLDKLDDEPHPAPDRWRQLSIIEDETASLTVQGGVTLRGPGPDCDLNSYPMDIDQPSRFWIRCRLASGAYSQRVIPQIAFVRCNVAEVVNSATFFDEVIGVGDGDQNQFMLRNKPIELESVKLVLSQEIDANAADSDEACTRVEDLSNSKPDDLHFTLNATSGVVQFGNGRQGRIPEANSLIIARSYRAGGGAAGNVAQGAIADPPLGVANVQVTNPRAGFGGQNEETIEHLLARAPMVLRGDRRVVTESDYQMHAQNTPGVSKAVVLPLYHPQHIGLRVPGCVTVVIIPQAPTFSLDNREARRFLPSQDLLSEVYRRLEERRPVGSEIFVVPPRYRKVNIRVTVVPNDLVSAGQAKRGAEQAILKYFEPLTDADQNANRIQTQKSPHWEMGELIYPTRLFEVILSACDPDSKINYVKDVTSIDVAAHGSESASVGTPIALDVDELVACDIQIDVPMSREPVNAFGRQSHS